MQHELEDAKRKTRVISIHKAADQNALGMKAIVIKLTGDSKSKFEVDHKLNSEQFSRLIFKLSSNDDGSLNFELFERYCNVFKKALNESGEPFKGDLENETYKTILAAFRAFDPNATN